MKKKIFWRLLFCVIALCLTFNTAFAKGGQNKPNILVILLDDYGVDQSRLYSGRGIENAPTPAIDSLAKQGIQFMNAWSAPNCMATRAQIFTGQLGNQTDVLNAAPLGNPPQNIDYDDPGLLPKLLREKAGYATAKIGKYQMHVGGDNARATLAIEAGYDYFFGNGAGYPPDRAYFDGDGQGPDPTDWIGADYFIPVRARFQRCSRGNDGNPLPWQETADIDNECGFLENKPPIGNQDARRDPTQLGIAERTYSTTWDVDEAIAWIEQQDGPWFMNLSYQAPHAPFVYPPEDLVDRRIVRALKRLNGGVYDAGKLAKSTTNPEENDREARLVYAAMVSALDTETGRLLEVLRDSKTGKLENTIVFILGDNGTPPGVVAYDRRWDKRQPDQVNELRAKSSYYEGGVNVPFIMAGAGIKFPGRKSKTLINTTDLFTTVLDLAGVDTDEIEPYGNGTIDGVSFAPVMKRKYFVGKRYNVTEIAHMNVPYLPPGSYPRAARPNFVFGHYEGSVIRNRLGFKLIVTTRYDEPRYVAEDNLLGTPLCGTRACQWSCEEGFDDCPYLERVKAVEFYNLRKDPYERNNLAADGIPGNLIHRIIFNQLLAELEDQLEVDFLLEYE